VVFHVKRVPDSPDIALARVVVTEFVNGCDVLHREDELPALLGALLGELDARDDAIAHLLAGWRPAKDLGPNGGGRRWTRSARRDGRVLNKPMEPSTQEVMYR
jgi:hypothetical protein